MIIYQEILRVKFTELEKSSKMNIVIFEWFFINYFGTAPIDIFNKVDT